MEDKISRSKTIVAEIQMYDISEGKVYWDRVAFRIEQEIVKAEGKLTTELIMQDKEIAKLQAEVAELKAKLDNQDAYLQSVLDSHLSLEQQLKDESWHDASELPTEEGMYEILMVNKRDYRYTYIATSGYAELTHSEIGNFTKYECVERLRRDKEDDYWKPFWRRIILPEGK